MQSLWWNLNRLHSKLKWLCVSYKFLLFSSYKTVIVWKPCGKLYISKSNFTFRNHLVPHCGSLVVMSGIQLFKCETEPQHIQLCVADRGFRSLLCTVIKFKLLAEVEKLFPKFDEHQLLRDPVSLLLFTRIINKIEGNWKW